MWAVLEPIAGIALLTLVFSAGFRQPPLGTDFAIFYATGVLPFLAYLDVSSKLMRSITYSKPLLFYPRVTYLDAILARFILNALTNTFVAVIVFFGIVFVFDINLSFDFATIALAYSLALLLGLSIGVLNCFLITKFNTWERFWGILNRPLFLVSCLFFLFESLPKWIQAILWFNPIVHIIGLLRHGAYSFYQASFVSVLYVICLSIFCLLIGLIFLRRYNRELLNSL